MNWDLIYQLLSGSCYSTMQRDAIEKRLFNLEYEENEFCLLEIESILQDLQENQLDRITHGGNFNQTDIMNHLKRLK